MNLLWIVEPGAKPFRYRVKFKTEGIQMSTEIFTIIVVGCLLTCLGVLYYATTTFEKLLMQIADHLSAIRYQRKS